MTKKEKDLVCGMMVDPDTAAAESVFQGKTYYFCAKGCKTEFDKNPEKYTSGVSRDSGKKHSGHCC